MIQEELNLHQSSHVEAFVFKLASKQAFQSFDLRLVWRILVNMVARFSFLESTSTNIISFTAGNAMHRCMHNHFNTQGLSDHEVWRFKSSSRHKPFCPTYRNTKKQEHSALGS
jgi:hypothetical protein